MKAILLSSAVILCSALTLTAADKKGKGRKDAAFADRDKNGDGYISIQEFMQFRSAPRKAAVDFKNLDKNGDSKLSPEEFKGAKGD